MNRINVKIPAIEAKSYPISIGTGTLCAVWSELEKQFATSGKFVVTDSNVVKAGHLETLLASNEAAVFVIDPAGEVSKTIDTAVAIVEAMEKAKRLKPDLVISDIMMPEIDGYEFYKNLRSNDNKKPVPMIFVTAKGQTSDIQKGLKMGIDAYITKPFDPQYLLRKIKELLDK